MNSIPVVTIVICHRGGTKDMLAVCVDSIKRHTTEIGYSLMFVVRDPEEEVSAYQTAMNVYHDSDVRVDVCQVDCPDDTRVHGHMLDQVLPEQVDTDYVMTLDSDCFPVADGWMGRLLHELTEGATCSGILHPWAPPPERMSKKKIEWRVRSQHCWETTHVACQLMRTCDVERLMKEGASYGGGDDTGLLFPLIAKANGEHCSGFRVTRCPRPSKKNFDAEFNRYVCLVYGDMVYHQGGHTRVALGDDPVFGKNFGHAAERVIRENGAEWLLDDANSYLFSLDREEEVAAEKMQRLFGMVNQRMDG